MKPFRRLWRPRGMASRLILFLVAALAVAEMALVTILRFQQDRVTEDIIHNQTLNQTVTLARLLSLRPAIDQAGLTAAFGSRNSCAEIAPSPPFTGNRSQPEQDLAATLAAMLHGVDAGPPLVRIEPLGRHEHPCDMVATAPWGGRTEPPGQNRPKPPVPPDHARTVVLAMAVPLAEDRWVVVRSAVDLPGAWSRITILSFLLSSLAVSAVAVLAVRAQTRSLRTLADAADRFGRGETVAALPEAGPTEVVAATHAFNTMNERLSTFVRDRLRLLASISHDLRTPLTTLRLKAEFIDDETTRDDIVASLDELTAISEATLAFTRAETVAEETMETDIAALARDITEEFRLAGAEVTAQPAAAAPLACRPVSLKRALRNLVENAVRYGGNARIAVERQDGQVAITVDDDGPGLPADRIEEAFQPFVRLEPSRSAETGGLGLGLAIARGIVAAHGGTLNLANRPEGGLRATMTLPG